MTRSLPALCAMISTLFLQPPALAAAASDDGNSAALRITPQFTYWRPQLFGTMRITKGSIDFSGTDIDVHDDAELGPASAWQLGLDFAWQRHRVRVHYEPMRYRGSAIVDEPFVYHGITYQPGERVFSHVDVNFYELSYDYLLSSSEHLDLRAGGGLYYWQFFSHVEGSIDGGSRTVTQVVPTMAAAAEGRWDAFKLGASAMLGTLGPDRQMIDLTGYAGLLLGERVELDLGYRWMMFDFKEGTNDADFVARGPYLSLAIAL
ncbi:MAG: hypothetical protein U1E76_21620 [Planctomycetota bacterium]